MSEHPEDFCQRCGRRNPVWTVDSDRFNTAVNRSEIICPSCFIFAHQEATGMATVWQLMPYAPFRWIDAEGRTTPFERAQRSFALDSVVCWDCEDQWTADDPEQCVDPTHARKTLGEVPLAYIDDSDSIVLPDAESLAVAMWNRQVAALDSCKRMVPLVLRALSEPAPSDTNAPDHAHSGRERHKEK